MGPRGKEGRRKRRLEFWLLEMVKWRRSSGYLYLTFYGRMAFLETDGKEKKEEEKKES